MMRKSASPDKRRAEHGGMRRVAANSALRSMVFRAARFSRKFAAIHPHGMLIDRRSEAGEETAMSKDGVCAIVTGSASGLGAATAAILAKGGGRIVVNYASSKTEAEQTADLCR